jgi:hypothetical protein
VHAISATSEETQGNLGDPFTTEGNAHFIGIFRRIKQEMIDFVDDQKIAVR